MEGREFGGGLGEAAGRRDGEGLRAEDVGFSRGGGSVAAELRGDEGPAGGKGGTGD